MDKFLMSSPAVEYDQRFADFYEPNPFDNDRFKKPTQTNTSSSNQAYTTNSPPHGKLSVNPLSQNLSSNQVNQNSTGQQQAQLQQQFQQMQHMQFQQKQQMVQHQQVQHIPQQQIAVRNSQSSLESIPQLSSSISNQSLLDSPASLYNIVTPRKSGRKKSSSVSSVNLYNTPSRGNYSPANLQSQASNLNLQSQQSISVQTAPTSNQWLAAATAAGNASNANYSNKVGKTPHRGHSRSRSRLSLDANNTPFLFSTSLNLNPFYTPSSFESPKVTNDELSGTDLEIMENFEATPLPTPTGSFVKLPQQNFLASGGKNGWYDQQSSDGFVTPMALQRNDLDGIKIEDQDDDALKQLRKAKQQMKSKSYNGNEFGGMLNRQTPASAPPTAPTDLFLDEIASHLDPDSAQSTPGILIGGNSPPLYSFATPGEYSIQSFQQQRQTKQQHNFQQSLSHEQLQQPHHLFEDNIVQSTPLDYNIDLIQGFNNRPLGKPQESQHTATLLPPMASIKIPHDPSPELENKEFINVKRSNQQQNQPIDTKKKHPCPLCDARFQRPEHVKRHMKSHSKEKPYECDEPECGKRFNRKDNLKAHLKKIHKRI